MLHQKDEFERLDAPFAEKKVDIKDGDIVQILEEAKEQPDRYNPGQNQTIIKIKTRNGERYVGLNQKSINILIDEFKTNNDKDWVGKEVKVLLNPTTIGGKKVIVAFLTGKDYELDDYGEPVLEGAQPEKEEDLPTIDVDADKKEDDVDVGKIPF